MFPPPWVNELHYDNESGDLNEGIEIAGPAGLDLNAWEVVLYNGSDLHMYGTVPLSGTLPDQGAGYGTAWFSEVGIQNGAPDGVALVSPSDQVVQFLSYEGSFTAQDGPAQGQTSVDIGVGEQPAPPAGESLQLQGAGSQYTDFTWAGPIPATRGAPNTGQTFQ